MARTYLNRDDTGFRVANHMAYDPDAYVKYAVPFAPLTQELALQLDEQLLPPSSKIGKISKFLFPTVYHRIAKNIFKITAEDYDALQHSLEMHYSRIRADIPGPPDMYRILHETSSSNSSYMVKVVAIPTMRFAHTALKEIIMQERIYRAQWNEFSGRDVVAKPMMCSPVWDGRKWRFVMVCEYAHGRSLHSFRGFFSRMFGNCNRRAMIDATTKVVSTLWALGFVHNDMNDYNIIYNDKTHTARLIDFETCVQLPPEVVAAFRKGIGASPSIPPTRAYLAYLYDKHYKMPALSLLHLSEKFLCSFVGDDRWLYNLDGIFMEMAEEALA